MNGVLDTLARIRELFDVPAEVQRLQDQVDVALATLGGNHA